MTAGTNDGAARQSRWPAILLLIVALDSPHPSGSTFNPWIYHSANLLVHLIYSLIVLDILKRLIRACLPHLAAIKPASSWELSACAQTVHELLECADRRFKFARVAAAFRWSS